MKLDDLNFKTILINIYINRLNTNQCHINSSVEQIEKTLRQARIYSDELCLLKILKERVDQKTKKVQTKISKIYGRQYNKNFTENSAEFSSIDKDQLKSFILKNDFKEHSYISFENIIAEEYVKKYQKI